MTIFTDTFTDSDGTALTAHTSDSGQSWVFALGLDAATIQTNKAIALTGVGTGVYYLNATPATADYTVEADITIASDSGSGVVGRCNAAGNTFYLARYLKSAGEWQLFAFVSGTATNIGSYAEAITNGTVKNVRLDMSGTAIKVYIDDVLRINVTNASVTSAGNPGLRIATSTGTFIDNFTADDGFVPGDDSIDLDDANLLAGLTPYNCVVNGTTSLEFHYTPSGFQVSFSGTSLKVGVSVSHLVALVADNYPEYVISVDNGPFSVGKLTSSSTEIVLATGLSDATHTVDFYVNKTVSTASTIGRACGIVITSMSVSSGGSLVSRTLPSRKVLIYGDSITRGRD